MHARRARERFTSRARHGSIDFPVARRTSSELQDPDSIKEIATVIRKRKNRLNRFLHRHYYNVHGHPDGEFTESSSESDGDERARDHRLPRSRL